MLDLLWIVQEFIYWCQNNKLIVQCIMIGVTGFVTLRYVGAIVFVKKRDAKVYEVISIATFVQLVISLWRTLP